MMYELWRSEEEGEAVVQTFFPVNETYGRQLQLLEPGSKLVWAVEADTYNEAMKLYHEHMGWEPYRPMDDE